MFSAVGGMFGTRLYDIFEPVICSPLNGEHLIFFLCQWRTFDGRTCLMFSPAGDNVLLVIIGCSEEHIKAYKLSNVFHPVENI